MISHFIFFSFYYEVNIILSKIIPKMITNRKYNHTITVIQLVLGEPKRVAKRKIQCHHKESEPCPQLYQKKKKKNPVQSIERIRFDNMPISGRINHFKYDSISFYNIFNWKNIRQSVNIKELNVYIFLFIIYYFNRNCFLT